MYGPCFCKIVVSPLSAALSQLSKVCFKVMANRNTIRDMKAILALALALYSYRRIELEFWMRGSSDCSSEGFRMWNCVMGVLGYLITTTMKQLINW